MESERLDTLSGLSSAHEFLAAILYKFQSEVRQYVDRTLNMKNFDVAIQALNKLINDEVHFAIRNLGIASHQHAIVRERIIEQIALRAFRIFSTHTTRHRKIQRKLWDKIQYDDLESIPVEHREVVKIERDTVRLPMFEKVISVTRYAAA